ncbi:MAG TPA: hypothetical protein VK666_12235 [Chryseolinea sp.]|nr:hypothetical protein [Chryseolinea sp.]
MVEIKQKSLKKGKQVDTKHVDTVIRNYKQERWIHNSKRLGKEDSLSVWYSIEELQEFMEMSKEHGADGVKLYFGAYDKDYKENPLYAGRQTVVLVATKQKETENGVSNKDVYIPKDNGSVILAWNAGGLCPPYCGIGSDIGHGIGITIVDKGKGGLIVT